MNYVCCDTIKILFIMSGQGSKYLVNKTNENEMIVNWLYIWK